MTWNDCSEEKSSYRVIAVFNIPFGRIRELNAYDSEKQENISIRTLRLYPILLILLMPCYSMAVETNGNTTDQPGQQKSIQMASGQHDVVALYDESLIANDAFDPHLIAQLKAIAVIGQKLRIGESEAIDRLMVSSTEKVQELFEYLLNKGEVRELKDFSNQIHMLESRLAINKAHGNKLAVQRDLAKVQFLKLSTALDRYLRRIWAISRGYEKGDSLLPDVKQALDMLISMEKKYGRIDMSASNPASKLQRSVNENLHDLYSVTYIYKSVLGYMLDHPQLVINQSWTKYLSLVSWIDYINNHDMARDINLRLNIFNLDVGGIVLFIVLFFMVVLVYPLIFRLVRKIIEKRILCSTGDDEGLDSVKGFIYVELRQPVRALIVFSGLDLAAWALFYRSDIYEHISGLTFVVYVALFFWLFLRLLNTVVTIKVESLNQENIGMRKELFNLIVHITKIITFSIACIIILMHFGISITAILSTLGIGGLAFALAAKDTLANFFGGIAILIDNVFRLGDWVRIKDSEGTVAEVGLRSTTIRTFDNALVTIPNSQVSTLDVVNWSKRRVGRRIKMVLQVTYESNLEDVRKSIDEIRDMLIQHDGIANPAAATFTRKQRMNRFFKTEDIEGIKNTQLVFLDRFSDYSVDILVYCFSKTVNWQGWLDVKEDVLYKIAGILEKNHVAFAYPTTEVKMQRDRSS